MVMCLVLPYLSLCGLSLASCAETVTVNQASVLFQGGIVLFVGVYSVCSWEEVSLGSSHAAILDLPLLKYIFK